MVLRTNFCRSVNFAHLGDQRVELFFFFGCERSDSDELELPEDFGVQNQARVEARGILEGFFFEF